MLYKKREGRFAFREEGEQIKNSIEENGELVK